MSDNIPIQKETGSHKPAPQTWAPLALGFRPFFLLGIWSAVLLIAISLYGFTVRWPDSYFGLTLWHAHEMVFGYAVAVIAGFLLTAVRNWTGLQTPTGTMLALLLLLWFMPRLLSALPVIPPAAFALLDFLFLPVLAILLGRLILKARQARNYPIPLLLLLISLCNGAMHLEALGMGADISNQSIQIAVCLTMALISVIAGRVVPFFMQSAIGRRAASHPVIEMLALPSILLLAASMMIANSWLLICSALIAAGIHSRRLIGWFDITLWQQPMLWVLYAGYAWMVAGFLLYGLGAWTGQSTAHTVHAWTVGGIGMFTAGMMARVALGHTGRTVRALPWIPGAFILIFMAALSRVILPMANPSLLDASVRISALCWLIAFTIIGIRYSSILLHARTDGKPG